MDKIDRIDVTNTDDVSFNDVLSDGIKFQHDAGKKLGQSIINYGGLMMGIFIVFVAITAMTTKISISSFFDIAALGLQFFILTFCSYAMYVSCADTGTKQGRISETYIKAIEKYEALKEQVIRGKMQMWLSEFCHWYQEEELKNTRVRILTEVGIDYGAYEEHWIGEDKKVINGLEHLSEVQKAAVNEANKIKPVHLSSDRMFKRGRASASRDPLGMSPERKKRIIYATKFLRVLMTASIMSMIVFDLSAEPSWALVAQVMVKIMMIIFNGFSGYKYGFENISYDTANYINDQSQLMEQFIEYVNRHKPDSEVGNGEAGEVVKEAV